MKDNGYRENRVLILLNRDLNVVFVDDTTELFSAISKGVYIDELAKNFFWPSKFLESIVSGELDKVLFLCATTESDESNAEDRRAIGWHYTSTEEFQIIIGNIRKNNEVCFF